MHLGNGIGDGATALWAILVGAIAFAFFWLGGVIISASGQLIRASLDGAVNTSPFLNQDQKAEAMDV